MNSSHNTPRMEDPTDACERFQADLSVLVDKEALNEAAACGAITHLETCPACSEFFDGARLQIRAHRDLADPAGLASSLSNLFTANIESEVESIELVCRLSNVFYQLGKAYVLSAMDPEYRFKAFEKAVTVAGFQAGGRGFIDGILTSGRGSTGGVDWAVARHMLNGKLEQITSPLEKGRSLLGEALAADESHEESRFYLAMADAIEGKTLRAAEGFQRLFREAVYDPNRAHAAMQLGVLHAKQGDHRRAISFYRWVTMSGLADQDSRFFWARFNIGVNYAHLGEQKRSLAAFRQLLDCHPDRAVDVADMFARSESTRGVISHQPGFAEALYDTCPEIFELANSDSQGTEEDR